MEMSGTEFFRDEMFRGFCRGELFWGLSFQGKKHPGMFGEIVLLGVPRSPCKITSPTLHV